MSTLVVWESATLQRTSFTRIVTPAYHMRGAYLAFFFGRVGTRTSNNVCVTMVVTKIGPRGIKTYDAGFYGTGSERMVVINIFVPQPNTKVDTTLVAWTFL